jgi:acetylglutamate synthase
MTREKSEERRGNTSSKDIDVKLVNWIIDTSFSRSRDKKYFRLIYMYWQTKSIVAQVIEEQVIDQKDFLRNWTFWTRNVRP